MTDTENSKTWITSKSIAIAARIPNDLHSKIEAYGMATYPKGENSYDKTTTLIDLISKGLGLDGSVTQNVIQSVNRLDVTQSVIHDVKQDILDDVKRYVMQSVIQEDNDLLGKLETAIADSPIIGEVLERLKKLESGRIPPITEDSSIAVLNDTDLLSSEDTQEDGGKDNIVESPLKDSEAVKGALVEQSQKPETIENPKSPPDTGIEGNNVELAKKSKGQKLKLSEKELEKAIADKDLKNLLALPLTGKEGKRELIKNLIPQAIWVKDRFLELEKKHPPKPRINGQKQSFTYSHLKVDQADKIIKEFCHR